MSSRPDAGLRRGPWGLVSAAVALVPFGLVLLFAAMGIASDRTDLVVYWSVPVCGGLAVVAALVGRARAEGATLRWFGLVLGSVEVVGFVAVLIALLRAMRTLGSAQPIGFS